MNDDDELHQLFQRIGIEEELEAKWRALETDIALIGMCWLASKPEHADAVQQLAKARRWPAPGPYVLPGTDVVVELRPLPDDLLYSEMLRFSDLAHEFRAQRG